MTQSGIPPSTVYQFIFPGLTMIPVQKHSHRSYRVVLTLGICFLNFFFKPKLYTNLHDTSIT